MSIFGELKGKIEAWSIEEEDIVSFYIKLLAFEEIKIFQ